MTRILHSSLLFSLIISIESGMIYRRYEKDHPKKNYVQVVEIFDTANHPPAYTENEKSLNDFLGRDAFKTDMNCTVINSTSTIKPETTTIKPETTTIKPETTTIKPKTTTTTPKTTTTTPKTTTTTPKTTTTTPETTTTTPETTKSTTTAYTIPTTAYRFFDNLFTIKSTKPTIRPNPKENENPDYTELYKWPTPNIQVTKHLPSTIKPPLILIKETDVQSARNQTETKDSREEDEMETTTVDGSENYDEQVDENEDDNVTENGSNDEYDEQNYDLAIDENDHSIDEDENYDENEYEDEEMRRRRRRINQLRRRRKHIQSAKVVISKV